MDLLYSYVGQNSMHTAWHITFLSARAALHAYYIFIPRDINNSAI